jgi:hypothetical protein
VLDWHVGLRWVNTLKVCLLQVGELLLLPEADPGGASPLLPQLVVPPAHDVADTVGELLFGPLAAGSSGTPEADRWQVKHHCSRYRMARCWCFLCPTSLQADWVR